MLELKLLEKNEIDPTGTRVYLTDATGSYDLALNPTGYGFPNKSRSEIMIFPVGFLIDSKGKKTKLEFQTFEPTSDSIWTALIPKDGWLQFSLLKAEIVRSPQVGLYAEGDVVFDLYDYSLLRKVGSAWKHVKEEELVGTMAESRPFEQLHIANQAKVKILLNKRISDLQMNSENLSNNKKIDYYEKQYKKVRSLLQAAVYQFCIGNKYEAARIIEFLETNTYEQL